MVVRWSLGCIDYNVVMASTPTSVRWTNPAIQARLNAFTAHHPGMSASAAISTLVDEGLRMREHPAIVFRDGPVGRRAALAAGSDVWEVIGSLQDAKVHQPELTENARVELVAHNAGLTTGQVQAAIGYYTAYPGEVDRMVREADEAEQAALAAWERRHALLQ